MKFKIPHFKLQRLSGEISERSSSFSFSSSKLPQNRGRGRAGERGRFHSGFSLIEVMLAMALLSLIVFALMSVFSATQKAFRASVTQTDVLEGGRAAMQMIAIDVRTMRPSGDSTAVNFAVRSILFDPPLTQSLPGSSLHCTNFFDYFFFLSHDNSKWTGIGYVVNTNSSNPLFPLYRYYAETNLSRSPVFLLNNFLTAIDNNQWTNLSHIMDGVVNFTVRGYDTNGAVLVNYNNNYTNNIQFFTPFYGEQQYYCYSNTVPAAVEVQMGVLEDRPLNHAESLPFQSTAQYNYLSQQAGNIHLFRQLIAIPNVDPTAYQ